MGKPSAQPRRDEISARQAEIGNEIRVLLKSADYEMGSGHTRAYRNKLKKILALRGEMRQLMVEDHEIALRQMDSRIMRVVHEIKTINDGTHQKLPPITK